MIKVYRLVALGLASALTRGGTGGLIPEPDFCTYNGEA